LRLSNTLTTDFCVEALKYVLAKYGCSGVFNTDQVSQFTKLEFIVVLKERDIRIRMYGRGH